MIKKPITIRLSSGLEARPVAMLVQVASQYKSEIYVESGRKKVNAIPFFDWAAMFFTYCVVMGRNVP